MSRRGYSIKDGIVKKRIVYNHSILKGNTTIYNMTDLQVCYDRQLVEIGLIIQESVEVQRLLIKLIAKILPIIEHHICTSFGASKEYYRG